MLSGVLTSILMKARLLNRRANFLACLRCRAQARMWAT